MVTEISVQQKLPNKEEEPRSAHQVTSFLTWTCQLTASSQAAFLANVNNTKVLFTISLPSRNDDRDSYESGWGWCIFTDCVNSTSLITAYQLLLQRQTDASCTDKREFRGITCCTPVTTQRCTTSVKFSTPSEKPTLDVCACCNGLRYRVWACLCGLIGSRFAPGLVGR